MPSRKRRNEFKEPTRRSTSKRRHKTSDELKSSQSNASIREGQSVSRTNLLDDPSQKDVRRANPPSSSLQSVGESEGSDVSHKSTQTAPSHKDQAISTRNHLVTPSPQPSPPPAHPEAEIKTTVRKSLMAPRRLTPPRPGKSSESRANEKANEKASQADFTESEVSESESTVTIVEESHVETQTDPEGVDVEAKVTFDPPRHPLPSQSPVPIVVPVNEEHDAKEIVSVKELKNPTKPPVTVNNSQNVEEEEDCDEECVEEPLTSTAGCGVTDECFPGFTECNDLDFNQLYGLAKECVDEVKEFGWFFISQCLQEFIYEDNCDPCTHRVGNKVLLECDPNAKEEKLEDCDADEGVGGTKVEPAKIQEVEKNKVKEDAAGPKGTESVASVQESAASIQTIDESGTSINTVDQSSASISGKPGDVEVVLVKVEESESGVEIKSESPSSDVKTEESESVVEVGSTKPSGVKVEGSKSGVEVKKKGPADVKVEESKSEVEVESTNNSSVKVEESKSGVEVKSKKNPSDVKVVKSAASTGTASTASKTENGDD